MATWDVRSLDNEKCSKCSIEYKVTIEELPLKDKDSFTCECGHVMRSWKTTAMYMYKKIKS